VESRVKINSEGDGMHRPFFFVTSEESWKGALRMEDK
jgi:hypothetical protein